MNSVEEFIRLSNKITMEYEAIVPLLRDPEVVKAARFLSDLDNLAHEYEFSPLDIMKLIDPKRALSLTEEKAKKSEGRSRRKLKR
jgi:hypothetical protein